MKLNDLGLNEINVFYLVQVTQEKRTMESR